jgi:hypothetical protein
MRRRPRRTEMRAARPMTSPAAPPAYERNGSQKRGAMQLVICHGLASQQEQC